MISDENMDGRRAPDPQQANQPLENGDPPFRADDAEYRASFREGTGLLHQGKTAEAVPFLEKAHALRPLDVDAGINLAGAYILTKKFRKAVQVLEPLSVEYGDHPMVWTNLGAAYLGNPVLATSEDQLRAIAAFERALDIEPAAPNVAYNLGLIYRDRRETDKAIEWFQKALEHNPRDKDARSILTKLQDGRN